VLNFVRYSTLYDSQRDTQGRRESSRAASVAAVGGTFSFPLPSICLQIHLQLQLHGGVLRRAPPSLGRSTGCDGADLVGGDHIWMRKGGRKQRLPIHALLGCDPLRPFHMVYDLDGNNRPFPSPCSKGKLTTQSVVHVHLVSHGMF
jgi:hypothetical protein